MFPIHTQFSYYRLCIISSDLIGNIYSLPFTNNAENYIICSFTAISPFISEC